MPHQVFISYRSADQALCDEVTALIDKLGYVSYCALTIWFLLFPGHSSWLRL
ncbi:MAG: hypothetical protein HC897_04355 [Thermoanaerobaculia bacterium]|nr:hypothetical protein [Thermoanaerobaculia bacterium]